MANYQLTHTGAELDDAVSIALNIYRVGSIYMSVNPTNPSTLFGGTWERIKDRFLLSAGDTYGAGDTGGEATHALTINEIPSHRHTHNISHTYTSYPPSHESSQDGYRATAWKDGNGSVTEYAGGGAAHNNMPPYLAVYMWVRTA